MSKETYWKCNRCKKKALGAAPPRGWQEVNLTELLKSLEDKPPPETDLCAECHESFILWWTQPDREKKGEAR